MSARVGGANKNDTLSYLASVALCIVSIGLMCSTDRLIALFANTPTGRVLSVSGEQVYTYRVGGKTHRERTASRYWVRMSVDSFPGRAAYFYVENPYVAEGWRRFQGVHVSVPIPKAARGDLGVAVNGILWYAIPIAVLGLAIVAVLVLVCGFFSSVYD